MVSSRLGDAVDGVATALFGPIRRTRSSTPTSKPRFFQAGEEAADRIVLPARRLRNFGNSGALGPAQQRQDLLLLGTLAWLAPACQPGCRRRISHPAGA